MPTATPFNAGRGNGFPFCLYSIDVNNSPNGDPYTHWTTLGGTYKDGSTATQSEINLSLMNAMKLFWNYNGHTSVYNVTDYSVNIDIDNGGYDTFSLKRPVPFFSNPKSRVCAGNGWKNPDGTDLAYWSISQRLPSTGLVSMRTTVSIVRMYEGNTNNEDNFIGYGNSAAIYAGNNGDILEFRSLWYENNPGSVPWPGNDEVFKYINLDGEDIPTVARALSAFSSVDTVTISDEQSATFERASFNTKTIKHQDFDFYTY
tara:strand:- start:30 stop:806 length:777 start_codon:yes stop_codon:yes gene_type:complete